MIRTANAICQINGKPCTVDKALIIIILFKMHLQQQNLLYMLIIPDLIFQYIIPVYKCCCAMIHRRSGRRSLNMAYCSPSQAFVG